MTTQSERQKSLQELGVKLQPPTLDSYLVRTIHQLHTKPIGQFTVEDLRIVIGQGIGLPFLVPLALEVLELNPFAEGDFYDGDLLKSVLTIQAAYWPEHRTELESLAQLVRRALRALDQLDTTAEIRNGLREAGGALLKIHAAAV